MCRRASPRGRPLTQARIRALAAGQGVTLVCGRFEGIDERVIEARGLEEVSVGDFVMAAVRAGFTLEGVDERAPDADFAARYPRAEKYVDWPMLVVLRLRR